MKHLSTLLIFCISTALTAQVPGTLDLSFDTNGIVYLPNQLDGPYPAGIAQQQDGKLVMCACKRTFATDNDIYVTRFNVDGSVDASFGNNGVVNTDFYGHYDGMDDVKIQPDGKILASGCGVMPSVTQGPELVRYLPDGSFDTTFGMGGKVFLQFGQDGYNSAHMVLQPDGKIVTAGIMYTSLPTPTYSFCTIRYNPDGSLDTGFGNGGFAILTYNNNYYDDARDIALQADGKILVSGVVRNSSDRLIIIRYNTNGSIDNTFANNGILIDNNSPGLGFNNQSVLVLPDGRIIAGSNERSSPAPMAPEWTVITCYHPNGTRDQSFGINGAFQLGIAQNVRMVMSGQLQPNGKIVFGGFCGPDFDTLRNMIIRIDTTGHLDPYFGNNGVLIYNVPTSQRETIFEVLVQADGKIATIGQTNSHISDAYNANTTVMRFHNDVSESVYEESMAPLAAVFPNPSHGDLKMILPGTISVADKIIRTEILNSLGQTALIATAATTETKDGNSLLTINTADLPPGIYLVKAYAEEELIGTAKFIAE